MANRAAIAAVVAILLAGATLAIGLWFAPTSPHPTTRVFNLDPGFTSSNNDAVWDPNFIPGFSGTPGVHVNWTDPQGGPGTVDYYVGPWTTAQTAAYPHFGVGPQAFNFVEVPRTQVYRSPTWGDYRSVNEGFNPCGVNLGNVTVSADRAAHPVYVGLPENGTDWTVALSVQWTAPVDSHSLPSSGRLSLVTTTSYPPSPGEVGARLAYTNLVLWDLTPFSGSSISRVQNSTEGSVGSATFPLSPLPDGTVARTYSVSLTPYLAATAQGLGLPASGGLLSYVYLSTEGFNVRVHFSVESLTLTGPATLCSDAAFAAGLTGSFPSVTLANALEASATEGARVGWRPTR